MSYKEKLQRQNKALSCLSYLPRMIITLHGRDNVTEFVLHDLCHESCFCFNKAAYFIDNPDFDYLKGIAGFSRSEAFSEDDSIWNVPDDFSDHMRISLFNQKVRELSQPSFKKKNDLASPELIARMAQSLAFDNHMFCSWPMKHDNHGLLIYEKSEDVALDNDYIINGFSLLSFCPVF